MLANLSTLKGFASISTDLFLPAIPTMATALHADIGTVELTISSYLIGFSLGLLVWGPISDRHGRRKLIAAGTSRPEFDAALTFLRPDDGPYRFSSNDISQQIFAHPRQ